MRYNYKHRYLLTMILIIYILIGCVSEEDDIENEEDVIQNEEITKDETEEIKVIGDDFFRRYIKLSEYLEGSVENTELDKEEILIREKYFEILRVPDKVYELDFNYELVKRIEINTDDGLGAWFSENAGEEYPALHVVVENGDLCFTASGKYNASKYIIENDEWIRYGEEYFSCPEYISLRNIFYEGNWRDVLVAITGNGNIYFENDNETIIIGNYNDFPVGFNNSSLIQPISDDISIWRKYFNIINIDRRDGFSDLGFLFYILEERQSINEIILPGTDKYKTFDVDVMLNKTTSAKGEIYLRLYDNPKRSGNREGHIMILDVENDALYNIRHPYYTEINENDDGALTTYVVGEDDNIYFQLVTEQAYYVYKIIPLWDSVEETEYNPRFIEFYPELQEIWDGL